MKQSLLCPSPADARPGGPLIGLLDSPAAAQTVTERPRNATPLSGVVRDSSGGAIPRSPIAIQHDPNTSVLLPAPHRPCQRAVDPFRALTSTSADRITRW